MSAGLPAPVFYVLVRHVLRRSGLDNRNVADYVAELLTEFSREERARCVTPDGQRLDYSLICSRLDNADDHTAFWIRAHIGNHSLFLSGVFPEHIRNRSGRRGAPGLRLLRGIGTR